MKRKLLVVYFSASGITAKAAKGIAKIGNGDITELQTVNSYSSNYSALIAESRKELQQNARPELNGKEIGPDAYDVIAIGCPNWCGTVPMSIITYLEQHDFTGKTILPFGTHGGSGVGRYAGDMKKVCPVANFGTGLDANRLSEAKITEWLNKAE